ncbi:MAG TPA: nitroreductase family deazaflavin-dependent oxidoreductase [Candidatus Sulfotelmatobacter sp.]
MPIPRLVAHFNLHVTNRILEPLARWAPGMGVVIHMGRKTRRVYRTPVMVFRRDNRFVIALTYGRDSQWVQNVLAANGCELETRNRTLRLSCPRLFHDERRESMPTLVRIVLGIINVSDFLELTVEPDTTSR